MSLTPAACPISAGVHSLWSRGDRRCICSLSAVVVQPRVGFFFSLKGCGEGYELAFGVGAQVCVFLLAGR